MVPDSDLWFVGFFVWIPWLWLIDDLNVKQAFFYGLVSGVSAIGTGYFWMTELLTQFAGFGMPLAVTTHLLFSCWQGATWGLAAGLFIWLRRRTNVSDMWLLPLSWTVFEGFIPDLFPTYMALGWCWHPTWIQLAELGGVTLVTFSMCAINGGAWVLIKKWHADKRLDRRALTFFLAWLIGVPVYGLVRIASVDAAVAEAPKVKFAVVQGNFGIKTFRTHRKQLLSEIQKKTAQLEREGAEIALWGETAYPYKGFYRDSQYDFRRGRRRVRRGFSIPLIFGVVTRERDRRVNKYPWNTAWVLNSDDTLGDRYDKVYPLLFGEAAPAFIDPEWYTRTIPNASHLNRGEDPGVLRVGEWRFGPLICYEDILPRYVHATAKQDVNAFVNLTNDSWFGNTREQPEHLGLAVFRSVEHRKALLRAVNAGISVYVDPAGRVVNQTEVTDSDREGYKGATGFLAEVPMMRAESSTVYGVTGDTFNVSLLLAVGFLLWRRRREAANEAGAPEEVASPSPAASDGAGAGEQTDAESP